MRDWNKPRSANAVCASSKDAENSLSAFAKFFTRIACTAFEFLSAVTRAHVFRKIDCCAKRVLTVSPGRADALTVLKKPSQSSMSTSRGTPYTFDEMPCRKYFFKTVHAKTVDKVPSK